MTEKTPITRQQRGFQYQIWLMLVIVIGVILAGFLMVPDTEEERQKMIELFGTTNQGDIVSPMVDVSPLLDLVDTQPAAEAPKWKVLIVGGMGCDSGCQEVLSNSRNVHMLLGKMTRRLERIYLPDIATIDSINLKELQAEHPLLLIHPIETAKISALLQSSSAAWSMEDVRYFIVTPDQKAILYYTQAHDGGGLLEDLKHLLKYSPDR
jgi:hypothetical protein